MLSQKHLKILKTWGITHVTIEGNEANKQLNVVIAEHPEYNEEADREAEQLFVHADKDHPFFNALIKHWKQRYIKNKASQQ